MLRVARLAAFVRNDHVKPRIPVYEAVIGLEVHAQLLTRSKAFSPEGAAFGVAPNAQTDPVSLGHPGTLPVLNRELVAHTVRMGLALNCEIAARSVFARKHYFYPDLPKGYQISQYDLPICGEGWIDVDGGEEPRRVRVRRIHMEEDAGKLIHDRDPRHTLVDLNRCGVPLIEIVTEPDIRTASEAADFVRRMRQIVRYLGICDGNMEEGSLRCDANVSVRVRGSERAGTKAEVKNLNSIRNVERAVEHEIERQIRVLEGGGEVAQETRLWDADRLVTRSMRSKEEAHDYRYFPDPDLPPVEVSADLLATIRSDLPELPDARRGRFATQLALPDYDAGVLTEERALADYFEETLALVGGDRIEADDAKAVSNFVMGDVMRVLNERAIQVDAFPIRPDRLAELITLRREDSVSSSAATEIFDAMLDAPDRAGDVARERGLFQVSDASALLPAVEAAIAAHPEQAALYRGGKEGLLGFFVGKVMREFAGAADPKLVRAMLVEKLGPPDA